MSPVDPTLLDASIQKIKAAYKGKEGGTGSSIQMGNEIQNPDRIPFTSPSLNWATAGGAPRGRMIRLYGGWSSGKSLTCWDLAMNAQLMDLLAAYYNVEKQYHPTFTASCGVDIDKLVLVQGTIVEDIGTKLEELLKVCHVHIIDSVSNAVTTQELAADLTQDFYAPKPRAWGKVLYRLNERLDPVEHTIVLVDQVRDNFDGHGANAVRAPGGHLIEHNSSLTLYFRRASWLFRDSNGVLDYEGESKATLSQVTEPDGIEIVVKVEKSRVGRPFRTARMRYGFEKKDTETGEIIYEQGIDVLYELANAAKYFKVVETSGNWFKHAGKSYNGAKKFRDAIADDAALRQEILDAMQRDW